MRFIAEEKLMVGGNDVISINLAKQKKWQILNEPQHRVLDES